MSDAIRDPDNDLVRRILRLEASVAALRRFPPPSLASIPPTVSHGKPADALFPTGPPMIGAYVYDQDSGKPYWRSDVGVWLDATGAA